MALDTRIDKYIKKAQPFAQPILKHLRVLVHTACPEVSETIKWGMPSFEYKGPYFGFASFKQHCVAGFWKSKLIKDPKGYLGERANQGGEAMGNFGCMKSMKDLPPDSAIINFLKQAKKLNDEGIKIKKIIKPKTKLVVPDYFSKALKSNKKAYAVFNEASYSFKKEYVMWLTEAKTEDTRERRMEIAIKWIAEGKGRNWKYEKKK